MNKPLSKDAWARAGVRMATNVSIGWCQKGGCDCNMVSVNLWDDGQRYAVVAVSADTADDLARQLKEGARQMRRRGAH